MGDTCCQQHLSMVRRAVLQDSRKEPVEHVPPAEHCESLTCALLHNFYRYRWLPPEPGRCVSASILSGIIAIYGLSEMGEIGRSAVAA